MFSYLMIVDDWVRMMLLLVLSVGISCCGLSVV